MKQFLSIVVFGLVASIAMAQQGAPAPVASAFAKQHPGVTVDKWEREGSNYEAEYKVNGTEHSSVYDAKGNLIETEVQIKVSELPPAITNQLVQKYGGQKVTEASKITSSTGKISYEAEVGNRSLLFDGQGNQLNNPDVDEMDELEELKGDD